MKKLLMVALLIVASAAAYAGDSVPLKAILKAKTYSEAEALLKSSLNDLASPAEKAKAYNHLVDLAKAKFDAESTIQTQNQVARQMGQEEKPVDVKGMTEAAYNALLAALECDKYDQMPNEKGKVAPKFAKPNAERLWMMRNQLVNAGQEAAHQQNDADVLRFWGTFIDSDSAPLFRDCDRAIQKDFFGQVARFAGIYAYQAKEYDRALRYAEIAMQDAKERKDALTLKLEILKARLNNREDSLQYVKQLEEIYEQNPDNDNVLENIYNLYSALGNPAAGIAVLDKVLARDPQNFVALADKGIAAMGEAKYDDAIALFKRAAEVKGDNAVIQTYLGTCLCLKAQDIENAAEKKELYTQAVTAFDLAKELDPDRLVSNWGYNRFNAYYNLYGENDERTKQAEAESH